MKDRSERIKRKSQEKASNQQKIKGPRIPRREPYRRDRGNINPRFYGEDED